MLAQKMGGEAIAHMVAGSSHHSSVEIECLNSFRAQKCVEPHLKTVKTECNLEEVPDDDESPAKSSKDKKANGPDSGKGQSLVFKITSKVPYKTVLKAHNAVLLKAESMQEKIEWINKIRSVMQPSKGAPGKGMQSSESGLPIRQSLSDGSLETTASLSSMVPQI